ncbi:hypothetical protein SAMN05444972_104208 [Marininema halotolerans]|uniref:Uncharacterized protein n=1 Tax=Marininema halotolerans TaxID=1155944 RepID=A0A1I6R783_9BACL|nr:hypothetical protein SAMN05444972_104208 [Marininema halotolerans]
MTSTKSTAYDKKKRPSHTEFITRRLSMGSFFYIISLCNKLVYIQFFGVFHNEKETLLIKGVPLFNYAYD